MPIFSDIILAQFGIICNSFSVYFMQAEQAADADGTGIKFYAGVAQLVEQRIRNAQVTCSSHATSSINVEQNRSFAYKRLG